MKSENKKRICVSISPSVIDDMNAILPQFGSRHQLRYRKSEFVEKAIDEYIKLILGQ